MSAEYSIKHKEYSIKHKEYSIKHKEIKGDEEVVSQRNVDLLAD